MLRITRRTLLAQALGLSALSSGCALQDIADHLPNPLLPLTSVKEPAPNPLIVPAGDFEAVWKQTVFVLDDYFDIASEDRLARRIDTQPQTSATLVEPWFGDSVSFRDRLEATMQTLRRVAMATVNPAPGGGYAIKVEVYKEIEDMAKPDRQAAGRASFIDNIPINRTYEIVGPYPLALGWIRLGRDQQLESVILNRIRKGLYL